MTKKDEGDLTAWADLLQSTDPSRHGKTHSEIKNKMPGISPHGAIEGKYKKYREIKQ